MSQNTLVFHEEAVVSPTAQPAYLSGKGFSKQDHPSPPLMPRGRKRRALLWGVGSTLLSAVGLIGLALFEQYNGMLSELRSDLKHFNETSSEYVKKDQFQRCWEHMKETSKEVNACNAARTLLEHELKASEKAREDLGRELQRVRERLAYLEGVRSHRGGGHIPLPSED